MAIEVYAEGDAAEDLAAHRLAELLRTADPEAASSGKVQVCIVAQVQCYGCSPQDIDLVLLVNDQRERPFISRSGVRVESCCVAIEVKSHTSHGIVFRGSQCYVRYQGEEHNVSRQSERQKWSLREYAAEQIRSRLYVTNLIWLTQLPRALCPDVMTNVLGSDASWSDFVDVIVRLVPPQGGVCRAGASGRAYFDMVSVLTRRLEPSTLDRRKLEVMCQRLSTLDTQYLERMGEQLLIFRGRGGTGKTIRLLQLAHHLYKEQGARALILTYNRALKADISRLLSVLRIQDGVAESGIGVRTIYQLTHRWLVTLGLLDPRSDAFLHRYGELKQQLLDWIRRGAITREDIQKARCEDGRSLAWDYILIDESQDWPVDERDLLYALYGFKQIVLADGVDQLIREHEPIDWRESLVRRDTQIVTLRKSLRLKSGLCTVVNAIAHELGLASWDLEPEPRLHGGMLVVLVGPVYTRELHAELLARARASGNSPLDVLLCVPPESVHTQANGVRNSAVGERLKSWGYEVWDGASDAVRDSFPISLEQHRIIQYESCRGLEGWTVVCFGLDKLYDRKRREHQPVSQEDLLISLESQAEAFANRWLMIPLTRAIDSLVIQIQEADHPLVHALEKVRLRYPELVQWRAAALHEN